MLQILIRVRNSDKIEGKTITEAIFTLAKNFKMSGGSVWQCIGGFGTHGKYSINIMRLTPELPFIIEIVDEPSKVLPFLQSLQLLIKEKGLITITEVEQAGKHDHPISNSDQIQMQDFLLLELIQFFCQNLTFMADKLYQIVSERKNKDYYTELKNIEIENSDLADKLLKLLNQGLFMTVPVDLVSKVIESLNTCSNLIEGVSKRLNIGKIDFSEEFTTYLINMTTIISIVIKTIHGATLLFGEKWDEKSEKEIKEVRKLEEQADEYHKEILHILYSADYNIQQEKDLDTYLEETVDELFKCYLSITVFGSELKHSIKEKRMYLP
jgi:hypothetical protein